MDVRNCARCGRMFNYVSGPPICPRCQADAEQKFVEVKKYIQDHKNAPITQIAEECEVTTSQIHQWIRQERLEFSEDSAIGLACEKCGAMIRTGRFCEKCKGEMATRLENAIPQPKKAAPKVSKDPKDNPKMRFLDR